MDWNLELERLNRLILSSPERNRKALNEFLRVAELARPDPTLDAAKALWWIAAMVDQRMRRDECQLLYALALLKLQQLLGPTNPELAGILHSFAYYLSEQQRFAESENYYQQLLALYPVATPQQQREMLTAVRDFAVSLEAQGRNEEAAALRKSYGVG